MQIKRLNPTTPSFRHKISICKNLLSKNNTLLKNLLKTLPRNSGRSSITGHITVRHKGAGCKKRYRLINFQNKEAHYILITVCYDPYRKAFISLVFNIIKCSFEFVINIEKLYPGSLIYFGQFLDDFKLGYRTLLKNIPSGSIINNLSNNLNSNAQYARAPGSFCQLLQKNKNFLRVKLSSTKIINVSKNAIGTLGVVSNSIQKKIYIGKAGTRRLQGIRPSTRGIAMNPVDHPHGGRTNGGRPSVTP
jgi:large subunit ribosomal protein L2